MENILNKIDTKIKNFIIKLEGKRLLYILILFLSLFTILAFLRVYSYLSESRFFFFINFVGLLLGALTALFFKPASYDFKENKNDNFKLLTSLFFIILILLIIIALNSIYYRSIYYYLLYPFSIALIAYQIYDMKLNRLKVSVILLEISSLMYFQKLTPFFINDQLPEWDTFFHYTVMNEIINNGVILNDLWKNFPLFHILGAMTNLIVFNGDSIYYIIILNIAIVLYPVIGFLIINKFFENKKFALLASLLIMSQTWLLFSHTTPHPFAFLLMLISMLMIPYIIFDKIKFKARFAILIFSSFAALMFHASGGLETAYAFLAIFFVVLFTRKHFYLFALLYVIILISYIAYYTGPLFNVFVKSLTLPGRPLSSENPSTGGLTYEGLFYYLLSHIWYPILAYFASLALSYSLLTKKINLKNMLPFVIPIALAIHPVFALLTSRLVEQIVGTAVLTLMMALISAPAFHFFNKRKLFAILLILLMLSSFSSILITDDNPYFVRFGGYYQSLLFAPKSALVMQDYLVNIPFKDPIVGTHYTLARTYYDYTFLETNKYFLNATDIARSDNWNANSWKGFIVVGYFEVLRNGKYELQSKEPFISYNEMKEQLNIVYSDGENFIFYN